MSWQLQEKVSFIQRYNPWCVVNAPVISLLPHEYGQHQLDSVGYILKYI